MMRTDPLTSLPPLPPQPQAAPNLESQSASSPLGCPTGEALEAPEDNQAIRPETLEPVSPEGAPTVGTGPSEAPNSDRLLPQLEDPAGVLPEALHPASLEQKSLILAEQLRRQSGPDPTDPISWSDALQALLSAPHPIALAAEAITHPDLLARTLKRLGVGGSGQIVRQHQALRLDAGNALVRQQALVTLRVHQQSLQQLSADLKTIPAGPSVEALFQALTALPLLARPRLLRPLGLSAGTALLQGDSLPFLFETSDPHLLEDPGAARRTLLQQGQATFDGHLLRLQDFAATIEDRLSGLELAEKSIENCEEPLLTFRPVARALAGSGNPWLEATHAQREKDVGGVFLEGDRPALIGDTGAAFLGTDTELGEALLSFGLIDRAQLQHSEHRRRATITLTVGGLIGPGPVDGVLGEMTAPALAHFDEFISTISDANSHSFALHFLRPLVDGTLQRALPLSLGMRLPDPTSALLAPALGVDDPFHAPLESVEGERSP